MIQAGIFGATSYTGLELISLLDAHPQAGIAFAASNSMAGKTLSDSFPKKPPLPLIPPQEADLEQADLVFLCLPHGEAAAAAIKALEAGCKVIDLSADFRLTDAAVYKQWYGKDHPKPELLANACYGLTETARETLPGCSLVANPGCYPTSVLLALYPLVKAGLLHGRLIVDSKSGVSGAGRKPKESTHFVTVDGNFSPYSIGRAHRHLPEMEQVLQGWGSKQTGMLFSPHLLPVSRGILSTIYAPLSNDTQLDDVYDLYRTTYDNEPFIQLLAPEATATLAHVVHTNMCTIGMTLADNTLILTSALDNLLKGASGQAVQNMNMIYGWEETSGLIKTGGDHASY
ncbi:MAG: N-acetyl-gamma-glutamyl-phosphate reductase [Anaerolineales bacterium]|nr:N-acetyl-gamma-glutamyl-phosphate reductase [Anaerolineales bacterium]